jgi:hypothetical protein
MNNILKRIMALLTAMALVAVPCTTCLAEGLEQDDDVVAGKMASELAVRPLSLCATIIGGVTFILTIPFSALGGNVQPAYNYLVEDPFLYTFARPLGDF